MISTRIAALATAVAVSLGTLAGAGTALASSKPAAPSCSSQLRHWSQHEGYWRLRALDLYTAHLLDLYVKAPPTVAQASHLLALSRASRQIPPPGCVVDGGYYWTIGRNVYAAYSDTQQNQGNAAEGDVQAADRNETALAGQVRNIYRFHGRFPSPPEAAR
jgi:hypothetical protein